MRGNLLFKPRSLTFTETARFLVFAILNKIHNMEEKYYNKTCFIVHYALAKNNKKRTKIKDFLILIIENNITENIKEHSYNYNMIFNLKEQKSFRLQKQKNVFFLQIVPIFFNLNLENLK